MRLPLRPFAVAALAAAAGGAFAQGISGRTVPVESAAAAARANLAAEPARAKWAVKVQKLLAKRTNRRSLADEIRSVAGADRIVESRLSDQTALVGAMGDAAAGYRIDLDSARQALALAAASTQVKPRVRQGYARALARFDAAYPDAALLPVSARLGRYAAAAAAARSFTPYDSGTSYDWVLATLRTAPANQGVDLTGDGRPDNQFASVQTLLTLFGGGFDLDQIFADALGQNGQFGILQMWYVQNLAKGDPFVLAGMYGATDADADPSNNLTGNGAFVAVPATLGEDGRPAVRVGSSVARGGAYKIDFSGQSLQFGGFAVPPGTKVVVQARATTTSNDGLMGFAIPVDMVVTLLETQGVDTATFATLLRNLADVDTDGTGGADAISISLAFTSVRATVSDPN